MVTSSGFPTPNHALRFFQQDALIFCNLLLSGTQEDCISHDTLFDTLNTSLRHVCIDDESFQEVTQSIQIMKQLSEQLDGESEAYLLLQEFRKAVNQHSVVKSILHSRAALNGLDVDELQRVAFRRTLNRCLSSPKKDIACDAIGNALYKVYSALVTDKDA
ncbi:hypothetical protein A1QO_04145 [Vibrio genomosp. F10 str. ZF-129]|uniref:Uncharacterized protein n=1 Tax=Vibrio genomosp. F10 str. ZF-129 TaxID=1187848 RepID=A0A1E5BIS7_9VIBR|nr:hypothetical protein [Vibrio genomosp. F10]OEE37303.1 hypothetical protein A1QO_04145 [Vibrio genomosp. F10 str. ZF-129]